MTYKTGTFSLHGSGYYGKGIGTTLMFGRRRSTRLRPAAGELTQVATATLAS